MSRLWLSVVLFALIVSAHSEVSFQRSIELSDYCRLGKTKINFKQAISIVSKGSGSRGETKYYWAATENTSFIIEGENLYINGRLVDGFELGEDYTYKAGILQTKTGKELTRKKLYSGRNNSWNEGKGGYTPEIYRLQVVGSFPSIGGGSEAYYSKGYLIWNFDYVCVRVWNDQLFLWGVNYGEIKVTAKIDLNKRVIVIDGTTFKIR